MNITKIKDVADTAIWVAAYRAEESLRKDALFQDPYASILIGDTGDALARSTQGSRYTAWSVVIRTLIIDKFILDLIPNGIDTVINLGAGLDTRPYRLSLPKNLRWIEVDFPEIIELKDDKLKNSISKCQLERVALDLSNVSERDQFFDKISSTSTNVLVITEGVVPYLSNEDARSLAVSLYQRQNFLYWISEYYSSEILEFLRTPKRLKQMENAPFLFYPKDWFEFFKNCGWDQNETKYFGIESVKFGRTPPIPGWLKNEQNLSDKIKVDMIKSYLGYSVFKRV